MTMGCGDQLDPVADMAQREQAAKRAEAQRQQARELEEQIQRKKVPC